jgi:hypothetical protein
LSRCCCFSCSSPPPARFSRIRLVRSLPSRDEFLVAAFLAGVAIHLYRDRIPYSSVIGVGAAIASVVLLQIADTAYLAAFPIAYLTVWIGLMRPPKIPFGDLSYGVYLFHFPSSKQLRISFLASGVGG